MATAWPTIAEPQYPINEKTYLPAVRTEKDSNYMQMRKKWTKAKKTFTLKWDESVALTEADYAILEAFFIANQGSPFTWTHPTTSVTYTVTFYQDELDWSILAPGYRYGQISLREI